MGGILHAPVDADSGICGGGFTFDAGKADVEKEGKNILDVACFRTIYHTAD